MHPIEMTEEVPIGIDIGGTFTDCVVTDSQGHCTTAKVLSTKDDPVRGVHIALSLLALTMDRDITSLLMNTHRFSHGTAIGTNAVLEHRGARVGLVTTAGHGEHLWVDNAGIDPQTGAINVAYAGLLGAFLCALTAAMSTT